MTSPTRRPVPLRIALVEFYGVGGTADYTDCLAQALAARGNRVAVITSSLFRPLQPVPTFQVIAAFHYRTSEPKLRKALMLSRALGRARHALSEFGPDVVHAQGTVMPAVERHFYRDIQSPVSICTVHDVRGHEWRPWLGSLQRFYATFDALICHSHASRQRLRTLVPRSSVAVIPHGRYTPLITTSPRIEWARTTLGIPTHAHVVLFFGFIRKYKGIELFLEALRIARQDAPSVVGLIAGRPMYDITRLRRRTALEGLPVRWDLRFIPRSEVATYFAAADVVALPYVDTSDSGMMELAAAYGKPVVTTNAGGLREAFQRYGVGAVVPLNDAAALARAMVQRYAAEPPVAGSPKNSWSEIALASEALYCRTIDPTRGRVERTVAP